MGWPDARALTKAYSGLAMPNFVKLPPGCAKIRCKVWPRAPGQTAAYFEIALKASRKPRHKSGIALRFPRMARWRSDKPEDANTLADLKEMVHVQP